VNCQIEKVTGARLVPQLPFISAGIYLESLVSYVFPRRKKFYRPECQCQMKINGF